MRRTLLVALGTMTLVSSAAAITFSASNGTGPPMGASEYRAAQAAVAMARQRSVARCAALASEARDGCDAVALAHEALRVAEIEAGFRGSEQSLRALQRARIELRYQAARARCASLAGPARDDCYIAAHALKGRALLDSASPYDTAS